MSGRTQRSAHFPVTRAGRCILASRNPKSTHPFTASYEHVLVGPSNNSPSDTLLRHLRTHHSDGLDSTGTHPVLRADSALVAEPASCGEDPVNSAPVECEAAFSTSEGSINRVSQLPNSPKLIASETIASSSALTFVGPVSDCGTSLASPPQAWDFDASWLLGTDFDLQALNTSISAAISEWGYPATEPINCQADPSSLPWPEPRHDDNIAEQTVQQLWVTHLAQESTTLPSIETNQNHGRVDDTYREDLSTRLRPREHPIFLPSTDFLVIVTHI